MSAMLVSRPLSAALVLSTALLFACGDDETGGSGGAGGTSGVGGGGGGGGGGQPELELCPDPNRATLHLTLLAEETTSTAEDRLSYGLFNEWPPMSAPARAGVILGDKIKFPYVLTDVRVPPTDLSVYACFDPGSDNSIEAVCTDMELWALYQDGAPVTFKVGFITKVELDLEAGTGSIVAEEDATMIGCEVTPVAMPATLEATVLSANITPGAGDTVSVSLFEAFPPAGPPSAAVVVDVSAVPVTVTVSEIVVGSYYVAACYDMGGDTPSCDGAGDVLTVHMGGMEAVAFGDGETVMLDLDLDAGP
jgi:hypothetical protein